MNKLLLVLAALSLVGLLLFVAPSLTKVSYEANTSLPAATGIQTGKQMPTSEPEIDKRTVVSHVPMPKQVKAIYMSSCVVGTPNFRQDLVDLIKATEVNSLMIDIKDFSGTLSFKPESPQWQSAWDAASCGAGDMREFIAELHKENIYVIGRITVFQDPFYTERHPEVAVKRSDRVSTWRDHKGLAFIDVAAKSYWDDLIALSVDAYNIGFDELNFDYVRYPSDGNMADTAFVLSEKTEYGKDKQANLEAFFKYLNEQLSKEELFAKYKHENTGRASSTPYTSADLFGMTTTNFDDLSIGQVQERAVPYFDVVAPMVYPSHYPGSFLGLGNPNDHPYKVVNFAMKAGVDRLRASTTPMNGFLHTRLGTSTPPIYSKAVYGPEKLRTWIQDFDYGGDYDAADVRAQIQASYDAGVMSWMIWAPSNRYTKAALLGPTASEV